MHYFRLRKISIIDHETFLGSDGTTLDVTFVLHATVNANDISA
jgi:hypothetical protein